jgi:hypothetical protein
MPTPGTSRSTHAQLKQYRSRRSMPSRRIENRSTARPSAVRLSRAYQQSGQADKARAGPKNSSTSRRTNSARRSAWHMASKASIHGRRSRRWRCRRLGRRFR